MNGILKAALLVGLAIFVFGCSSSHYVVQTREGTRHIVPEKPVYNEKTSTYEFSDAKGQNWILNREEVQSMVRLDQGELPEATVAPVATKATGPQNKKKTVKLTNRKDSPVIAYINFGADSQIQANDLGGFCTATGKLNCNLTLQANTSVLLPNSSYKYLNMALAFNKPVTCGSTKAEVIANNPNWFDILDVSVVDGFNEKIQMNVTSGGRTVQLGPPVGKTGNRNVFGVFPYGCTICAGIKDAPCGDAGTGECKGGTESKPDSLCQYQMNETEGEIDVILLP